MRWKCATDEDRKHQNEICLNIICTDYKNYIYLHRKNNGDIKKDQHAFLLLNKIFRKYLESRIKFLSKIATNKISYYWENCGIRISKYWLTSTKVFKASLPNQYRIFNK